MVEKKIEFILLLVFWIINLTNLKKIFISSDHAGFKLKEAIKSYLSNKKLSCTDMGPFKETRVDYRYFAYKVAKRVKLNKNNVKAIINPTIAVRLNKKVNQANVGQRP